VGLEHRLFTSDPHLRVQAGNTVDQSFAIEITVHPRRPATWVIGSCSFRVPDTLW
jgi:hypothetical protein